MFFLPTLQVWLELCTIIENTASRANKCLPSLSLMDLLPQLHLRISSATTCTLQPLQNSRNSPYFFYFSSIAFIRSSTTLTSSCSLEISMLHFAMRSSKFKILARAIKLLVLAPHYTLKLVRVQKSRLPQHILHHKNK